MDDDALDALVDSIRQLGVKSPLHVKPLSDNTYEVIAGHRRLRAARILNLADVPCIIEVDVATAEAWKLHENLFREELSPVDEALFYVELYEAHGQDTEAVAGLVRRPREHVERRLLLVSGDPKVLDSLRRGVISLGVAEEFNRIERPEDRDYYLHYAERGGCSVRQARTWRSDANARAVMATAAEARAAEGGAAGAGAPPPADGGFTYIHSAKPHELSSSTELRACLFCESEHEEWRMYKKHVCAPCADRHLAPLVIAGDRPRQAVAVSSRAANARDSLRSQSAGDSTEVTDVE